MEAADHAGAHPGDERAHHEGPAVRSAATRTARVLGLLRDDGTVAGWVRDAERLIGLADKPAVDQRASFFPGPDTGVTLSAYAERTGDPRGWSAQLQTPDGKYFNLRLSRLSGRSDAARWLLTSPGARPGRGLQPQAHTDGRPEGLAVWDAGLRYAWVNDVLEQQDGVPRARRLGQRATQVSPGFETEALEAVMRHVLRTGAPAIDYRHRQHDTTDVARDRSFVVSLFRLEGADGTEPGVCGLSVDVTVEEQRRERLAIVGEASSRIGTTRDLMRTSQELADFAVPLLADYVTVELAESVHLGEEPLALLGPEHGGRIPVFRRAAVASIHPGAPESLFERGQPVFVPPASPFTEVLVTGRSFFQPDLPGAANEKWFNSDPERARVVRAFGMHTMMVVPIRESGATLGVVVFVRSANPATFEHEDLRLAEELVGYTGQRLDDQRRYARERQAALALQRNLLPHVLNSGPGLEVASRYTPAEIEDGVGGDWFDVIALSRARTALVIGDVVGHGIAAAAAMGRLRTAVRTLAYMDLPPAGLFSRVDTTVMSFAEGDRFDDATASPMTGATCLILVYDGHTGRAVCASAGHPPPLIVRPDGTAFFADLPAGAPLGYGLTPYEQSEFDLEEGSLIAMFTDGLVESRGSDIDNGMERLATALARPGLPLPELAEAAFAARSNAVTERADLQLKAPTDDATLLLARTQPPPPIPPTD